MPFNDLVVGGGCAESAGVAQVPQDPVALGAHVADGDTLGDGVVDGDRDPWAALVQGLHDGVGDARLGGDRDRDAIGVAGGVEFAEAALRGQQQLAHANRVDDICGGLEAHLLEDFVGQGLLAVLLVGIARGAAIEHDVAVDGAVEGTDQVVVVAAVHHEVGGEGVDVGDLGPAARCGRQHQGADTGAGGVGGDGGGGVAGADHADAVKAKLPGGGDGGDG